MKQHLSILSINDEKIFHISGEIKTLLDFLSSSNSFIGIIFADNELKVVDTEDFFDIKLYEDINHNTTIVIDRNLLIAARELFDERKAQTERHKFFLSMLAYAIFTNSIFDPTITVYEGGAKEGINPIDDTLKLRTVDNIPLDTVLDLLFGNIPRFSDNDINEAKSLTKPLNPQLLNEDYNKQLNLFKQNYPYMLKAALLMRQPGLNLYQKIKYFFDWMMNEFITNAAAITFVIYVFNYGRLIKKYNTNNFQQLIDAIKNATWDLTLISYLKEQAKESPNRYYLLSSLDKYLLEAANYFLTPDESRYNNLYGNQGEQIQKIIDRTNKICLLPGRKDLIKDRIEKVDDTISSLEDDLKRSINSN